MSVTTVSERAERQNMVCPLDRRTLDRQLLVGWRWLALVAG